MAGSKAGVTNTPSACMQEQGQEIARHFDESNVLLTYAPDAGRLRTPPNPNRQSDTVAPQVRPCYFAVSRSATRDAAANDRS